MSIKSDIVKITLKDKIKLIKNLIFCKTNESKKSKKGTNK